MKHAYETAPGPPGTLSNLWISQRLAKGPQLAGFDVGVFVSAETFFGLEPILGHLSLRGEIAFPGKLAEAGQTQPRPDSSAPPTVAGF